MAPINPKDIFNLDNIDSIVTRTLREKKEVSLSDFNLTPYDISDEYKTTELAFKTGDQSEIRAGIEPIVFEAEKEGYSAGVFTALYEAVLNAHQHGNKGDPSKKVLVGIKMDDEQLDIVVQDEGGLLDANFLPFILRHREGVYREKFLDFYEFARKEKPSTNNGTGTSFMHQYMDEVQYLVSPNNGLIVRLIQHKRND